MRRRLVEGDRFGLCWKIHASAAVCTLALPTNFLAQLRPLRCSQVPRYGARGSRPYFFVSLLYISSRHCHTNHAATFSHHTSFHEKPIMKR